MLTKTIVTLTKKAAEMIVEEIKRVAGGNGDKPIAVAVIGAALSLPGHILALNTPPGPFFLLGQQAKSKARDAIEQLGEEGVLVESDGQAIGAIGVSGRTPEKKSLFSRRW